MALPHTVRKILNDFAAETHVDNLCPLADAQNRLSRLRKQPAEGQLRYIQRMVHISCSVHFLVKEHGINVIPARQNQCVVLLDALRHFSCIHAFCAHVLHGANVVRCVQIGNQNLNFVFHLLLLFVQSSRLMMPVILQTMYWYHLITARG